jgi:hypothetical protein
MAREELAIQVSDVLSDMTPGGAGTIPFNEVKGPVFHPTFRSTDSEAATGAAPPPLHRSWELPDSMKCPVVGTCLGDKEIVKILKKAKCKTAKGMSSYDLHACIMSRLCDENPISRATDNYLKGKYRRSIADCAQMDEDAFMALWGERFVSGEFDDLFYIACARTDLSGESVRRIFGDVHMLGHAHTRDIMRVRAAMSAMEKHDHALQEKLKQQKDRCRAMKKELSAAKSDLADAYGRIAQLSEDNARLRRQGESAGIDHEKRELRDRVRRLEVENRGSIRESRRLEREKRKLQIELFDLRSTNQTLAGEIKELMGQFAALSKCNEQQCNDDCRHYPVCDRRVLIVGGITRIKHLYRDLVESSGGEFDYHDGYMRSGKLAIDAKVQGADLVICPVNCNSHGACEQVKRLCKKHGKPFKMLPTSSLSAVSGVLYSRN